jgi:hypothetical protein
MKYLLSVLASGSIFTLASLNAADVSKLTFSELKALPLTDAAAQIRLAELGDPDVIRICVEQLASDDPQLVESAVIVLGGGRNGELLLQLSAPLQRVASFQLPSARRSTERIVGALLRNGSGLPHPLQQWAQNLTTRGPAEREAAILEFLASNSERLSSGRLDNLVVPQ